MPWPADRPFRILSLDGGGIKGLFTAKFLTEVEAELAKGEPLWSYFDMIIGTSTGGILGLGIAADIRAREMLELYVDHGASIFPKPKSPVAPMNWFSKMHDRRPLEDLVEKALGRRKLGESLTRMIIPGVDDFPEPVMRKTAHHPDYKQDWCRPAFKVALETSAAPIYLGGYEDGERFYLDGGLFINNPIMAAVSDVMACYDMERGHIEILSIGTGRVDKEISRKEAQAGSKWWASNAMDISSHLQSHNAIGQAGLLIGRGNICRVEPILKTDITMDDYQKSVERLLSKAKNHFEMARTEIQRFFVDQVEPYRRFYL